MPRCHKISYVDFGPAIRKLILAGKLEYDQLRRSTEHHYESMFTDPFSGPGINAFQQLVRAEREAWDWHRRLRDDYSSITSRMLNEGGAEIDWPRASLWIRGCS
ncbi:hypothetical protein ABW19_dt0204661 [Dactylella cylindrospora]|nr:hypothetical protein ABW19_dt0204661 [Dactylella cylindrospora]